MKERSAVLFITCSGVCIVETFFFVVVVSLEIPFAERTKGEKEEEVRRAETTRDCDDTHRRIGGVTTFRVVLPSLSLSIFIYIFVYTQKLRKERIPLQSQGERVERFKHTEKDAHTHVRIYIYICVCVCVYTRSGMLRLGICIPLLLFYLVPIHIRYYSSACGC